MSIIGRLLGYVSVLANLALALFLLGLGFIGSMIGGAMSIDLLPVAPESTATVLMISGLVALAAVVLAIRPGRFSRFFLLLWSLLVTGVLVWAFFRPDYRFHGEEQFRQGVVVFLGALLLLLGSFLHFKLAGRRDRT